MSNSLLSPDRTTDAVRCDGVVPSGLCVCFPHIPRTFVRGYCMSSLRDWYMCATQNAQASGYCELPENSLPCASCLYCCRKRDQSRVSEGAISTEICHRRILCNRLLRLQDASVTGFALSEHFSTIFDAYLGLSLKTASGKLCGSNFTDREPLFCGLRIR